MSNFCLDLNTTKSLFIIRYDGDEFLDQVGLFISRVLHPKALPVIQNYDDGFLVPCTNHFLLSYAIAIPLSRVLISQITFIHKTTEIPRPVD